MCCMGGGVMSVFGGISFGNWSREITLLFFLEEERGVCVGRPKCVLGL